MQNLTDAVDEIVTIGDFLAVSEAHILEDVTQCVAALQAKELDNLDRTAGAIQGRVQRVHQVVIAEMDNYEPDYYTDKVREDTAKLMEQITPIFTQRVATVIDALDKDPPGEIDENDFIGKSGSRPRCSRSTLLTCRSGTDGVRRGPRCATISPAHERSRRWG